MIGEQEQLMQTTKPKVQRTYIRVTDPDANRTLSWTIYNATPEQVKAKVEKAMQSKPAPAN